MITTITLNAAVDKTYFVNQFQVGQVHRVAKMLVEPGGKGINVAKVVRELGETVTASGWIGGSNGQLIEQSLLARGILCRMVQVHGESRVCLNIIDAEANSSTEILEPGPVVEEQQLAQLMQVYDELVRESSVVVLSGSMPQGVEVDFYAKLVKRAKQQGTFVILDTSGKALSAAVDAVDAVPNMLKPNAQELEQLVGASIQSDEELYNQARRFMQSGVDYMMMTRGADGVIAGIDGELYHAEGLRVNVVNTVGCGDSFVAGVAVGIHRGLPAQEMLALAVATSASNAMNQGAGQIRLDDVRRLQSQVVVRRIH